MISAPLSRIDLNLLVSLQILFEERSVTRAADRLFITQPAMSKTLQRLRELFDDPLFTRNGRNLVPTPKALELEARLPELLASISELVVERTFDPATHKGTIHLLAPEFIAVQIVPVLGWQLSCEAPNISLAVTSGQSSYAEQLAGGEVDFALEVEKKLPPEFQITPLGGFAPAIWMRRGHPLADQEVTMENMLEYPFIQYFLLLSEKVSPDTESRFDKTLAQQGLARRKVMVTDQLMTALDVLHSSDCLMLATMHDLKQEVEFYEIVRKPYPPELNPDPFIPVVLVQHRRTLRSPMHSWFRQKLLDAVKQVREGH